jgi:hypothetical protein
MNKLHIISDFHIHINLSIKKYHYFSYNETIFISIVLGERSPIIILKKFQYYDTIRKYIAILENCNFCGNKK